MIANSLALIVPAYNAGRYLYDLVRSIYGGETSLGMFEGQTLQPEELIICDDCSTDQTPEIVRTLKIDYPRVRYCKTKTNSGTSAACNMAIRNTTCEFITRIDADDMRESFSYEKMYPILLENPHSMIYDDVMIFFNGKRKEKIWKMAEYDLDHLLEENFIHAGIMFSRKAWEEAGGYREQFGNGRDDWAFNVALASAGYFGIHVDGPGYLYRREQQNRSLTNGTAMWQKRFCLKMEQEFKSLYEERNKMGCCGNRTVTALKTPTSQQTFLAGVEGMTILEYHGTNSGTESYFGPVTGHVYRFSPKKNRKQVDNRDLRTPRNRGLLDMYSPKGEPLFTVWNPPAVPEVPQVKDDPVVQPPETSDPVETIAPQETVEIAEVHPINPNDVKGASEKFVQSLAEAGLTTWEQFVQLPTDELAAITGRSERTIESMKKELTE